MVLIIVLIMIIILQVPASSTCSVSWLPNLICTHTVMMIMVMMIVMMIIVLIMIIILQVPAPSACPVS